MASNHQSSEDSTEGHRQFRTWSQADVPWQLDSVDTHENQHIERADDTMTMSVTMDTSNLTDDEVDLLETIAQEHADGLIETAVEIEQS